jgi:hypothetical protein
MGIFEQTPEKVKQDEDFFRTCRSMLECKGIAPISTYTYAKELAPH